MAYKVKAGVLAVRKKTDGEVSYIGPGDSAFNPADYGIEGDELRRLVDAGTLVKTGNDEKGPQTNVEAALNKPVNQLQPLFVQMTLQELQELQKLETRSSAKALIESAIGVKLDQ